MDKYNKKKECANQDMKKAHRCRCA